MAALGFACFVLLTGVLILRPADLLAELDGWPVYEVAILANLAVLLPRVLEQFLPGSLRSRPISLCVVGLLVAVPMSYLGRLELSPAPGVAFDFFKVVLSFLLMLAAVNTARRLRLYLMWLAVWVFALTGLALMQLHGWIDNPALAPVTDQIVDKTAGTVEVVQRLCGVGIFGNPNDLSRILVVGIVIGLYFQFNGRSALGRAVWLAPLGVFGYALVQTHSRGGFVALLVSLGVLLQQKLGGKKAIAAGALLLPLLLVAVSGRQADLNTESGTGQQRVQLWSDGFEAVRSSPLFGIGVDRYAEHTRGLGAHNSFVHSYVELGFFGGTLFTGAFWCALWFLARARRYRRELNDPLLEQMRPYVLAIVAGYVAGMLSSSRCYVIPTYLLLGLAATYLRLVSQRVPVAAPRFRPALAARLAVVSVLLVVGLQAFIMLSVRWEGK